MKAGVTGLSCAMRWSVLAMAARPGMGDGVAEYFGITVRKQVQHQFVPDQHVKRGCRITGQKQFEEFVEQAGGGNLRQQVRSREMARAVGVDFECQFGGKRSTLAACAPSRRPR